MLFKKVKGNLTGRISVLLRTPSTIPNKTSVQLTLEQHCLNCAGFHSGADSFLPINIGALLDLPLLGTLGIVEPLGWGANHRL